MKVCEGNIVRNYVFNDIKSIIYKKKCWEKYTRFEEICMLMMADAS